MNTINFSEKFIDFPSLKESTEKLYKLELSTSNCDAFASTSYVVKLLENAGFSDIEQYAIPCDGETTYDDCTMPMAWDRTGRSTLEIIDPELPEAERMLADTDIEPINLPTWSVPTPPEGVTAEVILLSQITSEDCHEAKGKIVLCNISMGGLRAYKLSQAGVAGLVSYTHKTADISPDGVRWINGVGFCGWYYIKSDKMLWNFSISPRKAMALEKRILAGETIRLHAKVNTKVYSGSTYTVTARIPGESQEEVALFAHLYEPFMADDAIGVTTSIAACKAIADAAKNGVIPKLKRSLRVTFAMERYGFFEFLHDEKRRKNLRLTLNMDALVNRSWELSGAPFQLRNSSAAVPCFSDIVMRDIAKRCCPELQFIERNGNLSDDTFSADSLWQIPSNWLCSTFLPEIHHNTHALFAEVDWKMLPQILNAVCGYLTTFTAESSPEKVADVRRITISGAAEDCAKDLDKLAKLAEQQLYDASDVQTLTRFIADYHTARIVSLNTFFSGAVTKDEAEKIINSAVSGFSAAAPEKVAHSDIAKELKSTVVSRNPERLLPMSLALVPEAERRRLQTLIPEPLLCALLDGKRNLYEAWLISEFMLDGKADAAKAAALPVFFRDMAKYGYYTIR